MRLELVIFDCDGVLVDTERVASRVLSAMLSEVGYGITADQCVERFMGRPTRECYPEIEAELGRSLPVDFGERFDRRVLETFLAAPRTIDGVVEVVDRLSWRRCIASSSDPAYLRQVLGATGLWGRFEGVFSASEVARGKPAPDVFLHAAARMGVRPERCLVIEDSVPGVRAAVAAGMPVLGFADLQPASALARHGAHVFQSMGALSGLVATWAESGGFDGADA